MSDINTQMSGSGNNGDVDTKNFRQKNWRSFDGGQVYDFNIYKLNRMIRKMESDWDMHPDLEALCMILEMYRDGEVNITWKEGFPFADIDWDSYYLDTGESGIMEEDWWEEY